MIDWMQKHKKWLIVTIWISTIAFIAAGMVGWGSYNFNLDQGVVARVGDIKVTQRQYDTQFRQLFNQYNSGGDLDLQKAKEMGLDELALSQVIQRALIQNFAQDLGLYVSPQEVSSEIAKIEVFQEKDLLGQSKFNLKLYQEVLKNNNLIPAEFEASIKQDLLIKKALEILPKSQASELEKAVFLFPFEIMDTAKIQVLSFSQFHPKPTQEEVKKFWEAHQNKFLYPAEFKIDYVLVEDKSQNPTEQELKDLYEETKSKYLDENNNFKSFESVKKEVLEQKRSELAEEKALQEYIALKGSEKIYGKEEVILEDEKKLGIELQEAIEGANIGETYKPIKTPQGYIVFKLIEKKPQSPKSFEDAIEEAREMLISQEKASLALNKAKELLQSDFKGTQAVKISLTSQDKITSLSDEEKSLVSNKILSSLQKKGYIPLMEKIIVYEIDSQSLTRQLPENFKGDAKRILELYKEQMFQKEFFKYLENKYKIIRNISLK
ncbi:peptidylprolyl isomerase [Helicobacter cholecystus]|uniref:peptidylprolyl isomerase n=1 Tax=Helicobacter cholecystus TaxID=45498 RepID=UPI002739A7D1|nr:peptidylprolyl isomerase [Helicobacter cholecystus]